jgi:hypothetical protein
VRGDVLERVFHSYLRTRYPSAYPYHLRHGSIDLRFKAAAALEHARTIDQDSSQSMSLPTRTRDENVALPHNPSTLTGHKTTLQMIESLEAVLKKTTPRPEGPTDWFPGGFVPHGPSPFFRPNHPIARFGTPSEPLVNLLELPYLTRTHDFSYALHSASIERLVSAKRELTPRPTRAVRLGLKDELKLTALEKAAILEDMFVW